jgi:prepilin-type N-terminal cleavage/methylation domain-containing protein
MKKKAFTLVELLVVIAIIAMLLAILMPALSRVRSLAFQMICATNESGLGKAILLYSNENEEKYPRIGTPYVLCTSMSTGSNMSYEWDKPNTLADYGETTLAWATVTSSLFLLVKYADVNPSQFICSAHKATKFELNDYEAVLEADSAKDITECWDFGPDSAKHVSYSYNYPYSPFSPDASSSPTTPIIADLSPWMEATPDGGTEIVTIAAGDQPPQLIDYCDETEKSRFNLGNSPTHGMEGQNILFNDMHVKFMKTPNVGIEQDNIYTRWSADPATDDIECEHRQQGDNIDTYIECDVTTWETIGGPMSEDDAVLVQW